jgi:hypothetical protein
MGTVLELAKIDQQLMKDKHKEGHGKKYRNKSFGNRMTGGEGLARHTDIKMET